jgi:hypothetical protein
MSENEIFDEKTPKVFKPTTIDGKEFTDKKSYEEFKAFFDYFSQGFKLRPCHQSVLYFIVPDAYSQIIHSFWFLGRRNKNRLVLEYLKLRDGISESLVKYDNFSDFDWNLVIVRKVGLASESVLIRTDQSIKEELKNLMNAIPPFVHPMESS